MPISIELDEKEIKKKEIQKKFRFFKKKITTPQLTDIPNKKIFNWKKLLIFSGIAIVLGLVIYGGFQLFNIFKSVGFNLSVADLVSSKETIQLQKDSTGKYTSVLVVGIDTRENSGGLNTDTIIVVTYNYETNNIIMESIPRDTSVEIGEGSDWYNKINSVYAYAEGREEESGLTELKRCVEEMVGLEIQYYTMVNFQGFIDVIDTLGGVYINVENSFTDYSYPAEVGTGYQTVSFTAGPQTMDGETALKYSRSRHSSDNSEGTDFARARRQQKVIEAVKNSLLDSETYTNPQKVLDLLGAVSDNLTISEFTINDIKAGLNLMNIFEENKGETYSFVLDLKAGNGQLISNLSNYDTDGTLLYYIIGPTLGLGNYESIHEYIQLILDNPSFYEEDSTIYVYDAGLGYQETYTKTEELREQYPYTNITFRGTLYYDKEGTVMYEHESGLQPSTLDEISSFLNTDSNLQPEYITTNLNGEDITILFGSSILEEETLENE